MYFVIRKSTDGKFYFTVTGANNEEIVFSETYGAKGALHSAIEDLRAGAATAVVRDVS